MNEVIELAKKCGLSKHEYRVGALVGYEITIQAFYEAAIEIGKAQGAKEFMEALGEPVAYVTKDTAYYFGKSRDECSGVFRYGNCDDANIPLHAMPNTKDEVK